MIELFDRPAHRQAEFCLGGGAVDTVPEMPSRSSAVAGAAMPAATTAMTPRAVMRRPRARYRRAAAKIRRVANMS